MKHDLSTQQRLASLQHLDLRRHSIDELARRVRELLEGQPLRCLEFAPGLLLYRGLPCQELPRRLADVSSPPPERVQHDQRANRASQLLFYCSATWHPPFFEACQLGQAFDGPLYPSAAMSSPAHNLALHPSTINSGKLALDYVEYLQVRHVAPDTDTLEVHSLDIARHTDAGGCLCWRGQPGNWVLREDSTATDCQLEGGHWQC